MLEGYGVFETRPCPPGLRHGLSCIGRQPQLACSTTAWTRMGCETLRCQDDPNKGMLSPSFESHIPWPEIVGYEALRS